MSARRSARIIDRDRIDLTGDDSDVETVNDVAERVFACDDLFPPPVDAEDNVYRVERILGIENTAAGRLYYVKWFGYPMRNATWVHERDVICCEDAILEFMNSRE